MNPSRTTEIKVGLFTLVGLAVLIFGVMWGKQQTLGSGDQRVTIRFPSSGGLIRGDGVTVNGVKKGRVEEIDVDGNSVLAHVTLESGIPLHADATAVIMMLELMGGKKIDIAPGASPKMLGPSDVIMGTTAMDIPGAMAMLGTLSTDLTRVMYRADTLLGSINHLMTDKEFIESIRHTVFTLDATASLIKSFVARNQGDMEATLKDVRIIVSDVKDFFQANRPQFEKLLKDADRTMTGVDRTVAHADSALVSVDKMFSDIKNGGGTLHKLIYDKEFADHLDSTVANAHRLINMIEDHGVNVNLRLGTRP